VNTLTESAVGVAKHRGLGNLERLDLLARELRRERPDLEKV